MLGYERNMRHHGRIRITSWIRERVRLWMGVVCQAGVDLEEAIKAHRANQKKPAAKRRAGGVLIAPKQRPPVSKVLLVGGATRMPSFQRFVRNMTGIAPDPLLVDPDLVSHLVIAKQADEQQSMRHALGKTASSAISCCSHSHAMQSEVMPPFS